MTGIELSNVSRWYGNVVAVNDITMSIGPGVTGLLGPNGAGKSTILHMIAGFLAPSKGTLTVGGKPSWLNPGIYKNLGLVPERDSVYAFLTGEQFVRATAKLHSLDPRQRIHMMDLLAKLGAEGRVILFSSHILEEVERLSGTIQVMVAGRLAASGDFRAIRRLMTSRPHVFNVRSSDDRRLAAVLVGRPYTNAVEFTGKGLQVRTNDFGAFCAQIAVLSRDHGIALRELLPTDESLESVFGYLISSQGS